MKRMRSNALPGIEDMIDILRFSSLDYFQTKERAAIRRFLCDVYTQYCRICDSPEASPYIKAFQEYFGDDSSTPLATTIMRNSFPNATRRDLNKWKTLIELAYGEGIRPGNFRDLLEDQGGINGAISHLRDVAAEKSRKTILRKHFGHSRWRPNERPLLLRR